MPELKNLYAACPGVSKSHVHVAAWGTVQVNGRQVTTFQQRIKMDIEYINNRSILFDLKILLKTIPIVFRGKGAF